MTYPGGKGASGVAQTIINQQPPHDRYFEPFLGGGSVMRWKRPAAENFGADLDPEAVLGLNELPFPKWNFECLDGIEYLLRTRFGPRDLVYCDPPYVLSARRRNRRIYRCELTDAQHRVLLNVLLGLDCMVQVSGYWSPLYAEMLEGWRLVRFQAMTRGGLMEECLWMNYPEPKALHDYRFLGVDFRERERIRRKTSRWRSRIAALPEAERLALLSAMVDVASTGELDVPDPANEFADVRRPETSWLMLRPGRDRTALETAVLQ